MKFADLVVVFVEGARLDLRRLIARYGVYTLERQRDRWGASAQKQFSTAFVVVRVRDEREARGEERIRGCSSHIEAAGNSVE